MTKEQITLAQEVTDKLDILEKKTMELIEYSVQPKKLALHKTEVEGIINEIDNMLDRIIEIFTAHPNLMTNTWMPYLKTTGIVIGTVKGISLMM